MRTVLLQTILQHCFLGGMEDVAQPVNMTGLYSLKFEVQGTQEIASLRYWNSDQLVKVQLCRYSPVSNPARNQLLVIARVLSFLSTSPHIVCMSGCTSEVLQTVEQSSLQQKGVEYPVRYKSLSLHKLMQKREGSVFGRIDFFTQLKYIVAFLAGSLDEPWIVHTPELAKVSITDCGYCLFVFYKSVRPFIVSRLYPVVIYGFDTCRLFALRSTLLGPHHQDCAYVRDAGS